MAQIGHYPGYANAFLFLTGALTGSDTLNIVGGGNPDLNRGSVQLAGTATNPFSGTINVISDRLDLNMPGMLAVNSTNIVIGSDTTPTTGSRGVVAYLASDQLPAAATVTFKNTPGNYGFFRMQGFNQTLAGISDLTGRGIIENTSYISADVPNSTLTLNDNADSTFAGRIRDTAENQVFAAPLTLVKNGTGTMTLPGVVSGSGGFQVLTFA